MFVLMDMEWVTNADGKQHPSQIAAMRVDNAWEKLDLFTTRIRPLDESFHIWDHVGYTGGKKRDYLNALPAKTVFRNLLDWLKRDDELCWWRGDGIELFKSFAQDNTLKHIKLYPYVVEYMRNASLASSPYRLLDNMGVTMEGVSNHSKSDVKTMRAALQIIAFPHDILSQPFTEDLFRDTDTYFRSPYVLDTGTYVVHKSGCALAKGDRLCAAPSVLELIKTKYKACKCCTQEVVQARREKNRGIINRSEYAFVYSPDSKVFHKRGCQTILSAKHIMGSIYYRSCRLTGRCPCLVCKPMQADETAFVKKKSAAKSVIAKASLTKQEQRALDRLRQAQVERKRVLADKTMLPQKREDMMVLSRASVVFWAAAGYGSFHLRHCGKLKDLSHLKGFSRYEEAVREGYQPCRWCKPTSKHNLEVSLPIYSKERTEETIAQLKELCDSSGFLCKEEMKLFTVETDKGIWRIHIQQKPYRLEHRHKVCGHYFDNEEFHRQPKIFLSLQDVVTYIKKHDN